MKEKILIIEDEEDLVKGLKLNLEGEGYDVSWALDGEEGLNKALGKVPDLILLDIMLPEKSGLDVCKELRKKNVNIPIIMLTSRAKQSDAEIGTKSGADEYLFKPYNPKKLLEIVKKYIEAKKN